MSVLDYSGDDLFIYRIIKYHTNNPERKWANTYEFQAVTAGGESELLALGEILVDFEAAFHRTYVVFDRITISTWEADSVPYDPAAFISSTLTANGTLAAATDPAGLKSTVSVARIASSGRFGHIFYRGNLLEDDLSSPAGITVLTNRTAKQDQLDDAITSSGLDDYIAPVAPSGGPLRMVMVNKTGSQVRIVTQLRVQNVSILPQDHAWFNRTAPTP